MKRCVTILILCLLCAIRAMAQETSKDSILIMRDSIGLHYQPKHEIPKQSPNWSHSLEKKDINELIELDRATEPIFAPENSERLSAEISPFRVSGGASSGFVVGVHHSLLFSNSKTLRLDYKILKNLSLSMGSTIGNTSVPWLQIPINQYSGYLGLNYSPIASVVLSTSINMGSLMGERYYNPVAELVYTPNQNWELTLYGGAYFSPMLHGGKIYNAIYGGVKAKYTTDLGIFIYGKGSISKSNLPYNGSSPKALFNGYSSFGGGVGYQNIGVGANYSINPLTGRSRVTYEVSYDL
ncbi:hypothetical protein QYZ87_00830 [Porphyromonadaceae bacterium W3.11]|nr:hypothetical protein [Porphyromonadaceae bacterium W3.11]